MTVALELVLLRPIISEHLGGTSPTLDDVLETFKHLLLLLWVGAVALDVSDGFGAGRERSIAEHAIIVNGELVAVVVVVVVVIAVIAIVALAPAVFSEHRRIGLFLDDDALLFRFVERNHADIGRFIGDRGEVLLGLLLGGAQAAEHVVGDREGMKGEGIVGGAKIDTRGWREDRYARSAMARWIKLSISIVQRTGDQQDGKCAMTGIRIDSAVN